MFCLCNLWAGMFRLPIFMPIFPVSVLRSKHFRSNNVFSTSTFHQLLQMVMNFNIFLSSNFHRKPSQSHSAFNSPMFLLSYSRIAKWHFLHFSFQPFRLTLAVIIVYKVNSMFSCMFAALFYGCTEILNNDSDSQNTGWFSVLLPQ